MKKMWGLACTTIQPHAWYRKTGDKIFTKEENFPFETRDAANKIKSILTNRLPGCPPTNLTYEIRDNGGTES